MWKNPMQATPSIIQVDFGANGQNLQGDGEMYCAPTSVVMGLYYLSANGFTQLAPASYGGQEDQAAINLERVIAGLMGTTAIGGTGGGFVSGVVTYMSACGLSPDQYTVNTVAWPDFADRAGRAPIEMGVGGALVGLGAAALVGGFVWALSAPAPSEAISVRVSPGGLSVGGSF